MKNLESKLSHSFNKRSINWITTCVAVWGSAVVSIVYWFTRMMMNDELTFIDLITPLCLGLFFTIFVVYIFSRFFAHLENERRNINNLKQNESDLKSSLARSYIEIINQRDETKVLSKEHERLRGNLSNEIQQRQATQDALEEQRVFNNTIIELTPDVIMYKNIDGEIKGVNANFMKVFNVADNQELSKCLQSDLELFNKLNKGDDEVKAKLEAVSYECEINDVILQIKKCPVLSSKGKLIGIMCYGHDITELKHEQEIIEKEYDAKSSFISTLSHELRTPLNGIVGLSEILLRTDHFKDEDLRNLKAINVNAVTLGNIFNDVIDINKFERRTFNLAYEPVNWPEFLESLETLANLMAEQKKLQLDFCVAGDSCEYLELDATRLRQILWNLITNAIKFTSEGKISINVINHKIGDFLNVTFKVKDTGIGIAKEEHENIFKLYYQVKGTKQATGTGIGLNVTKELCNAMHGVISLESELGKGSEFTLNFNFKETKPKNIEVKNTNKNILLVEDVDLNILVAKSILEGLGNSVIAAKTGMDAISAFKENEFDLVLLDMQLPDMTGLEVADNLVKIKDVPMVALTANAVNEFAVYQEHNILDVIPKPVSVPKLREVLSKY